MRHDFERQFSQILSIQINLLINQLLEQKYKVWNFFVETKTIHRRGHMHLDSYLRFGFVYNTIIQCIFQDKMDGNEGGTYFKYLNIACLPLYLIRNKFHDQIQFVDNKLERFSIDFDIIQQRLLLYRKIFTKNVTCSGWAKLGKLLLTVMNRQNMIFF